jgi:hypothetical protein
LLLCLIFDYTFDVDFQIGFGKVRSLIFLLIK